MRLRPARSAMETERYKAASTGSKRPTDSSAMILREFLNGGRRIGTRGERKGGDGGQSWIRTSEGVSQRIYSPPRLATSVSTHPLWGGKR